MYAQYCSLISNEKKMRKILKDVKRYGDEIISPEYHALHEIFLDSQIVPWMSEEFESKTVDETKCYFYADNFEYRSINKWILSDFPKDVWLHCLQNLNAHKYDFGDFIEYTKLVYNIWNRYMSSSKDINDSLDKKILEELCKLKTFLLQFSGITYEHPDFEDYNNKAYRNFLLLGILPLLGNEGLTIMREISTWHMSDAEDGIFFALNNLNLNEHHQYIFDILISMKEEMNPITKCRHLCLRLSTHHVIYILDKCKKENFDYKKNEEFMKFLNDNKEIIFRSDKPDIESLYF